MAADQTRVSGTRPTTRLTAVAVIALSIAAGAERLQPRAERIVSLIPAVTEMLFAIGAGPRVVGVGTFDEFPAEVRSLPRVGALLDPDLERIISLKPDLVVVYATQADLQQQLDRAKIPTFRYEHAGLADVTSTIRALGSRVGNVKEAAAVAGKIEAALADIRERTANRPRPRTMLVFGREALSLRGIYASGGVGFLHDMLEAAGGENVFADVKRQSVQATTEIILARGPEVILELRGTPISHELQQNERSVWQALTAVPAVKSGRIVFIADQRTVVPGPRVAEGTELLARVLHPEAFK
jgi:cobalamin transport system substrate-binding protein